MPIPTIQMPAKPSTQELSDFLEQGVAYIPVPSEVIQKLKLIEKVGMAYFNHSQDRKSQYPFAAGRREGFLDQTPTGYAIERYIIRRSLPDDPAWVACGDEMLEVKHYFQHDIIQPLLLSVFEYLKLDASTVQAGFEDADSTLSVVYYPACSEEGERERIRAHEDASLMTILWSQKPGLEMKVGQQWLGNLMKEGYVLVNVGGALSLMTDGLCHAITHRVRVADYQPRLAIASFFSPPSEMPLVNVVTQEQVASTFADYVSTCLKNAYPTKALEGKTIHELHEK